MRDAKPLVGKLLALLLVQHHAVSKPAVFVVPLDLPAAGEMQMGSGEISGRGGGWEGGGGGKGEGRSWGSLSAE